MSGDRKGPDSVFEIWTHRDREQGTFEIGLKIGKREMILQFER